MSECSKSKYCYKVKVYACLHQEEIDKGHIWFNTKNIASRSIVRIENTEKADLLLEKENLLKLKQNNNNIPVWNKICRFLRNVIIRLQTPKIYCELLQIDNTYKQLYNNKLNDNCNKTYPIKGFYICDKNSDCIEYTEDTIVMHGYYRNTLKIKTSEDKKWYRLKITKKK